MTTIPRMTQIQRTVVIALVGVLLGMALMMFVQNEIDTSEQQACETVREIMDDMRDC